MGKRVHSVCEECGTRLYCCEVCEGLFARIRKDQKVCGNRCRVRKSRAACKLPKT